MIYKCKPVVEAGVNGFTLHPKLNEEDIRIGELDGYVYFNSNALAVQDERLIVEEVVLTEELREKLKALMPHKEFARMKIADIADIADLLADCMKLIEFNMMLTTRLAGDIYGTNPIPPEIKEAYKTRNKLFLDAVDAGTITLRGDFDNMDVVMARLLGRVSAINSIVRDSYVDKLKKAGL